VDAGSPLQHVDSCGAGRQQHDIAAFVTTRDALAVEFQLELTLTDHMKCSARMIEGNRER
jgi:hypothetical protein